MPICINGSCNHNTQTWRRKKIVKFSILKYHQHAQQLFAVSLLSAASTNVLFLQTLIFHPQTKLGVFQDTFSVSLAWIKFEVLLCIYVICNEHKVILTIWIVLKTNKKLRKYLPVTITELLNTVQAVQNLTVSLQNINYFILSSDVIHVLTA